MRLDDDDFRDLKEAAHELKLQHSVLAREIIRAALELKKEQGLQSLITEKKLSA
ncbi:hypothetical protein D3C85_1837240 [compost metagenome]